MTASNVPRTMPTTMATTVSFTVIHSPRMTDSSKR